MKHRLGSIFFRHGWMPAACAAIILAAVLLFTRNGLQNWGLWVLLLCPVMHLLMRRHRSSDGDGVKGGDAPRTAARRTEEVMPWHSGPRS